MLTDSTFKFLKDLKKNNNREWFAARKPVYDEVKLQVIALTAEALSHISKTHPEFANVDPAKCVLRIYRDVRFSTNKAPYKTNIGVSINPKGKGTSGPGYYLHIEPGASFIGGGWWMPPAENLKNIRQEIDYNAANFRKIISHKDFKKYYGKLSEEDRLQNAPKGYEKDHAEIEFLRLKSFVAFCPLSDDDFSEKKIATDISKAIDALVPLVKFLEVGLA